MPGPLASAVGTTVRHFRKRASLSQEALAARARLDRTYVSGVERGVRNITLDSLEAILNALGVDFHDFFAHAISEMHAVERPKATDRQ